MVLLPCTPREARWQVSSIPDGWMWVGKSCHGPCDRCHYVFETQHMPDYGDARCVGCRAIEAAGSLQENLARLLWDRERLTRELETAYRRIAELEDDLAEARGAA